MLNSKDEQLFIAKVLELVSQATDKNCGVAPSSIIFDLSVLRMTLNNARVPRNGPALRRILEDINDILSLASVCKKLEGVYSLSNPCFSTLVLVNLSKSVNLCKLDCFELSSNGLFD